MPVSGKEESGVIARQSSNCSAGVPIKKRRYPMVTPPSPPRQELPSPGAENDLAKKEHSNRSQESSLSDVSVATNSSGLSGVNNNPFAVEREEGPAGTVVNSVGNNATFSRVKLEEQRIATCSGSVDNIDSKKKLLKTGGFVNQRVSENTELHLAPSEVLAPIDVMGIPNKQKFEEDWKLGPSTYSLNADLSLSLKEPVIAPLAGENSKNGDQTQEKLDPSFSLSFGRGESLKKCNSNEFNSVDNTACLSTDRSNWDLNTTMDAWEGLVGGVVTGEGAKFGGSHVSDGTDDVKPSISSAGLLRVTADLGKQICGTAEQRSDLPLSNLCSTRQHKSEDSLNLRLSVPFPIEHLSQNSSGKLISSTQILSSNVPGVSATIGSIDSVGCRSVKTEPFGESRTLDFAESGGNSIRSLDLRTIKGEMVERLNLEVHKFSSAGPQKLNEHRPIKPEPTEDNQELQRKTETSPQSEGKVVECENNFSSKTGLPLDPQKPCSLELPRCSAELSTDVVASDQPDNSNNTNEVPVNGVAPTAHCDKIDRVASETVVRSMNHHGMGLNASDGMTETSDGKNLNVENPGTSGIKLITELPLDSRGNGEGSISDDEKLNIPTDLLEEDSYSSDSDSDGNHAVANPRDTEGRQLREDDEYEDGEVREPILQTASEGPIIEVREAENCNRSECDIKHVDFSSPSVANTKSGDGEKAKNHEDPCQTSDDQIKECVDTVFNKRAEQDVGKDDSLQESVAAKVSETGSNEKKPVKTTRRKLINLSGGKIVEKAPEMNLSCAGPTNISQGPATTVELAADKNNQENSIQEKNDSALPKSDPSLNCDDLFKDANTGGKRGVIISLPRATNVSPCKTRSIPGRSFPSRSERERYNEFEGEKFHPRGNRDEIYIGGPRKFIRGRMEEQTHRNSRLNFIRGRGRVSSRLDGPHGDWDSNNDFSPEMYNGPSEHRFSRHKHPAADNDPELDCSGYIVGGGKPLDDELPSFRHSSSRRRSPGGNDGLAAHGVHIVHRIPRSISPTRCITGDGSDNFALRHGGEKFMRGLQDDIVDPIFARPQPPCNGVDRPFVRGNRNFYPVQRRGLPRIQSKSPIRSRSRSPGLLSSSRRRTPEGFSGLPELTHRRSPPIYRMERMRSSGRPCFPEDMMARRHGSPPYMSRSSNELREMESGRDHIHLRPVLSDRGLPRSTRRFDIIDPRERTNDDEFFGGPMHSSRFHKLGDDGNGDERRKCVERRGPVRSFRPPYNNVNAADSEFLERSNLREREFDGRIKNRSVNPSRRTRSIEELEGNYRHGGQVWHDDEFDDVSRVKRKRF